MKPAEEIAAIVKAAAYVFEVTPESLIHPNRGNREQATARQVSMYLCALVTDIPRHKIGRAFGRRSREVVDTAFRNIPNRCKNCPVMSKQFAAVLDQLNLAAP